MNLDKGEILFYDRNLWEGVMIVFWFFLVDLGVIVIIVIKVFFDYGVK